MQLYLQLNPLKIKLMLLLFNILNYNNNLQMIKLSAYKKKLWKLILDLIIYILIIIKKIKSKKSLFSKIIRIYRFNIILL